MQAPQRASGQCPYEILIAHRGQERKEGGGDGGDAAGESVHVVQQIKGIRNSHHPEQSQDYVQDSVKERTCTPERMRMKAAAS